MSWTYGVRPVLGLRSAVERLMTMHALARGLTDARSLRADRASASAAERRRVLQLLHELVLRGRATGALRADLDTDDVVLALMANEGIRAATPELRVLASQRFATLILAGFRAP